MGLVDVIAVGSTEVRGCGDESGEMEVGGMAVGWNEVNDLEVMRVGKIEVGGDGEVRGLIVATVGTDRVTVGSIVVEWAACGDSRKWQGPVHQSLLAFIFKQPKK